MVKWPWISKEEMNGEIFSGSSGVTAPMGVQFLVSCFEIRDARVLLVILYRSAMLFASCGWSVVDVALSLNAP